ncbi:hypothetical protein M3Y99_01874500 [Aphelenchoides fujianensis]|nr:hypothetical protein M3Y99_01874500 [Aphelenchoides fujianensis]
MVVKIAVSYSSYVPYKWRRVIEFSAILMLSTLVYVHYVLGRYPGTCFDSIKDTWPRKGVLRVEVISNLKEFELQFYDGERGVTHFNLKHILTRGPRAIPEDARSGTILTTLHFNFGSTEDIALSDSDMIEIEPAIQPTFLFVGEYSAYHGLLKLPASLRQDYKIDSMLFRIDGADECLHSWNKRLLTRHLVGVEEIIISSFRALAPNESDKGYMRDLLTGDNYHFITGSVSKTQYLYALLIMLLFTFAISMLLRFSHHQIFLFILDLLQMFELNEPLVFPIAPLLTVILALVGMETIMSEIFHDTLDCAST